MVDWTAIAGIVAGTVMVVMVVAIIFIGRAIGRRGMRRKEFQELRQDISQIKNHIEEIREQLADIVIRLG